MEEHEAFARMNRAYKEKFGFPMATCAREHIGASILSYAGARLENSRQEEVETSLAEVSKIADLRLQDLVE